MAGRRIARKEAALTAAGAAGATAAVIGTALVQRLALNLNPDNTAKPGLVDAVLADIRALAQGVRDARRKSASIR